MALPRLGSDYLRLEKIHAGLMKLEDISPRERELLAFVTKEMRALRPFIRRARSSGVPARCCRNPCQ
jgi:hypothetical protein